MRTTDKTLINENILNTVMFVRSFVTVIALNIFASDSI